MSTSSFDLKYPTVAIAKQEEDQERMQRLSADNTASIKAFQVADIIKKANFPTTHGHIGN